MRAKPPIACGVRSRNAEASRMTAIAATKMNPARTENERRGGGADAVYAESDEDRAECPTQGGGKGECDAECGVRHMGRARGG